MGLRPFAISTIATGPKVYRPSLRCALTCPLLSWFKGSLKFDMSATFQSLGPGMQRIIRAHEQVHVDNARPYSSAFKAQIDDHASGWVFGVAGEKTISTNDYTAAYNDNFGGLHPSCETDEAMAYKRSVEVAEQVLADPAFANEHDLVRLNLPKFEAESDAPSTCD